MAISFPVKNGASVVSDAILPRLLITPCFCVSSWLRSFGICIQDIVPFPLCHILASFECTYDLFYFFAVICLLFIYKAPWLFITTFCDKFFPAFIFCSPYRPVILGIFDILSLRYWLFQFQSQSFDSLILLILGSLSSFGSPLFSFLLILPFTGFDFLKTLFHDIDIIFRMLSILPSVTFQPFFLLLPQISGRGPQTLIRIDLSSSH